MLFGLSWLRCLFAFRTETRSDDNQYDGNFNHEFSGVFFGAIATQTDRLIAHARGTEVTSHAQRTDHSTGGARAMLSAAT